ncbi:MAG TPA: hypothetical protein VHA70_08075 [Bauldia sp.]|nr:hypothetical protein [Bauldia sp.]
MPRWVRRSLIAAGALVALLAVAMASGHGPWRHFQHTMAGPVS